MDRVKSLMNVCLFIEVQKVQTGWYILFRGIKLIALCHSLHARTNKGFNLERNRWGHIIKKFLWLIIQKLNLAKTTEESKLILDCQGPTYY